MRRFLDTRLTSRFMSLHFSWSEWPQTARCPRLSVCGAASRGQVRGRGCEARPRHHLVERGEAAHRPDYPGSLPAPGENKSRKDDLFNLHTTVHEWVEFLRALIIQNVLIFHGWNLVSFQILQIATLLNLDQNMHSNSFSRLTFENVQFIPFYRQVLMEMWRWALYGSLPR